MRGAQLRLELAQLALSDPRRAGRLGSARLDAADVLEDHHVERHPSRRRAAQRLDDEVDDLAVAVGADRHVAAATTAWPVADRLVHGRRAGPAAGPSRAMLKTSRRGAPAGSSRYLPVRAEPMQQLALGVDRRRRPARSGRAAARSAEQSCRRAPARQRRAAGGTAPTCASGAISGNSGSRAVDLWRGAGRCDASCRRRRTGRRAGSTFSEVPRNRIAAGLQRVVEERDHALLQLAARGRSAGCGRRSGRAARTAGRGSRCAPRTRTSRGAPWRSR